MSKKSTETGAAPKRRWRVTRRGFLIGAGALAGTAALGVTFGLPVLRRNLASMAESGASQSSAPTAPNAWFEVLDDDRIRFFVSKSEMGQGVHTALAQLAAEELEITLADIDVFQATTAHLYVDGSGTGASNSVSVQFDPLRQAAATLREMMRAQAAAQLNIAPENLIIKTRGFEAKDDTSRRIAFGKLAATQKIWIANIPKDPVPLKPRDAFKIIGESIPRVDIPAKVTGQAIYGYDMRVDGMLYGAVVRPPMLESKLKSANGADAEKLDGVKKILIQDGFAGVVATSRSKARAAAGAIQAQWDEGKKWQQAEIDALIKPEGSGGVQIQLAGNPSGELSSGDVIRAEYRSPFAIQTPLEAQAALADVGADKAKIWSSTQHPDYVARTVSQALGFKKEQVEVVTTYLGGGFGRKSATEVAVEAALLSRAAGAPVHVGWSREEELRYGYLRPPTHSRLAAKLDASGRIVAMEHLQGSGDVLFLFFPGFLKTMFGADLGSYRGAMIRYDIANKQTTAWNRTLPVRTGPWRGLGAIANTFAVESFIDELAHAAKIDPLQFRLNHLGNDAWGNRMRSALETVAKAADWGAPLPAGRVRGIACATDVDTVVAQVADVSLDEKGAPRVHTIHAVMDCGLVVNPDGAKAQVEGNVMWGVGSALVEEARVEDGRVSAANFDGYPLLSIKNAPRVNTILLESDGKARGVGEPAIAPVAAAIGNAVFALTGKRLRQMPFTAERVAVA
jgi:isoquinoline 1-oxidoreductase subunit beta